MLYCTTGASPLAPPTDGSTAPLAPALALLPGHLFGALHQAVCPDQEPPGAEPDPDEERRCAAEADAEALAHQREDNQPMPTNGVA